MHVESKMNWGRWKISGCRQRQRDQQPAVQNTWLGNTTRSPPRTDNNPNHTMLHFELQHRLIKLSVVMSEAYRIIGKLPT